MEKTVVVTSFKLCFKLSSQIIHEINHKLIKDEIKLIKDEIDIKHKHLQIILV